MKKVLISLFVAMMAFASQAMVPNMTFGVDYDYSSKGGNSGFGFQLEYQFLDNLRIAPEFIYSFLLSPILSTKVLNQAPIVGGAGGLGKEALWVGKSEWLSVASCPPGAHSLRT